MIYARILRRYSYSTPRLVDNSAVMRRGSFSQAPGGCTNMRLHHLGQIEITLRPCRGCTCVMEYHFRRWNKVDDKPVSRDTERIHSLDPARLIPTVRPEETESRTVVFHCSARFLESHSLSCKAARWLQVHTDNFSRAREAAQSPKAHRSKFGVMLLSISCASLNGSGESEGKFPPI